MGLQVKGIAPLNIPCHQEFLDFELDLIKPLVKI
jgi:hypothetical protein